jgi:hypothetical protein
MRIESVMKKYIIAFFVIIGVLIGVDIAAANIKHVKIETDKYPETEDTLDIHKTSMIRVFCVTTITTKAHIFCISFANGYAENK